MPEVDDRLRDVFQGALCFEDAAPSGEDAARASRHSADQLPSDAAGAAASRHDYLESLGMQGSVAGVADTDIPHAVQLLAKTNRVNLVRAEA